MAAGPSPLTGIASTDLGLGGSDLAAQVRNETEEERKKRLQQMQQQQMSPAAASLLGPMGTPGG